LTEAGSALLEEVPNILMLTERAHERTLRASKGLLGRLDVGIFGSGILNVIPKVLADFHAERADVTIRLHSMTKPEQLQALRERRIVVGFHRLPPEELDIASELVTRERMFVGLYEGHRLCDKEAITPADLANEPMILYPNSPMQGLEREVINMFRHEDVSFRIEQQVEDVLTCIALVAGRFGICITTESTASCLLMPHVVYRPLQSRYLTHIELRCVYLRGNQSPLLQGLLQAVRRYNAVSSDPAPGVAQLANVRPADVRSAN
jgi:DNA-binding transcriptional LysR family regulator